MISVDLPHVSVLECHPQLVFQIKGIQGLYDNLGTLMQHDVSVEITSIQNITMWVWTAYVFKLRLVIPIISIYK
jgi:hypothetical protein